MIVTRRLGTLTFSLLVVVFMTCMTVIVCDSVITMGTVELFCNVYRRCLGNTSKS